MKTHKIKGGFLRKYFPALDPEVPLEIEVPGTLKELAAAIREGKLTLHGVEFPLDEEGVISDWYRGFSLQHQGAGALSEEEKAEKALDRRAEREALKELKEQSEVKEAIARKRAEIKAKNGK